ncbi:hypothetical protein GQ457_03G023610 [Hibiscus cannabinus]
MVSFAKVEIVPQLFDALAACESSVTDVEQIATILNGLPPKYQPFMAVITSSQEPFTLDAVKTVLIDVEAKVQGFNTHIGLPMSANTIYKHREEGNQESRATHSNNHGYSGGRFGAKGRGRVRLQCQLCGKNGHSVDRCWHRFDQTFTRVLAQYGSTKEDSVTTHVAHVDNS